MCRKGRGKGRQTKLLFIFFPLTDSLTLDSSNPAILFSPSAMDARLLTLDRVTLKHNPVLFIITISS